MSLQRCPCPNPRSLRMCYLLWQKRFCTCHYIGKPEVRILFWVIWVGPMEARGFFWQGGKKVKVRESKYDLGTTSNGVRYLEARNAGSPSKLENVRKQFSPEVFRKSTAWSAPWSQLPGLDLGFRTIREYTYVTLNTMVVVICHSDNRDWLPHPVILCYLAPLYDLVACAAAKISQSPRRV